MNIEVNKEIKLAAEHIKAIEKALNHQGITEASVRVENGKIVILQINKKRVT